MAANIKLTKTEMARYIVMALYNLPRLPDATHWHVKRLATLPRDSLQYKHRLAANALASIGRELTILDAAI